MIKKYIVRLSKTERKLLQDIVKKFKRSSQKVRRAQVLLKADADGPAWSAAKIAEAFGCRIKTVENIGSSQNLMAKRKRATDVHGLNPAQHSRNQTGI